MAEFFLELFSEEIPASLQKNARENLLKLFRENFEKKNFSYKSGVSYSTPNRLVFFFDGMSKNIQQKAIKIKGPRADAPKQALEGFIKSNNLDVNDLLEESTEKGKFYFAMIKSKIIYIDNELTKLIPEILGKLSWKKSMKWADYELSWGKTFKINISFI